jgi:hypothetical protein
MNMPGVVYVDAKKVKSNVAKRPKPRFQPVIKVAGSEGRLDIRILMGLLKAFPCNLVEPGGFEPPTF